MVPGRGVEREPVCNANANLADKLHEAKNQLPAPSQN